MFTLLKLVVIGSAAWVYHDAASHKIGRIQGRTGWDNLPAGAWGLASLWLCFIGFPAYLMKRNELIARAEEQPVEASYFPVKLGLFAVLFVGVLLQGFGGGAGSITFAEQVDANLNTVNEGNHFSTGMVHMVIRGTEAFADNTLTVYFREEGSQAWHIADEHRVSPEWDTIAAPIVLYDAGAYEVQVQTASGRIVAEDTVYVE